MVLLEIWLKPKVPSFYTKDYVGTLGLHNKTPTLHKNEGVFCVNHIFIYGILFLFTVVFLQGLLSWQLFYYIIFQSSIYYWSCGYCTQKQ